MANLLSTTVNGNLITSGGYTTSNYTRILYPSGGSYVTTTSVITGAIRIKLPTQGSAMMMTCTVKVYEYSVNKSFTITFGGHRDGNNWYNEFCYLDGDSARGNLTVRFGVDDGKDCVWIGDTSTQWSHPQVFVTDVQLGYTGYNQTWASGWSVDFVTSFATINRIQTAYAKITNANIGSQSVNYATSAGDSANLDGRSSSRYLYYRGISSSGDFQSFQSSASIIRFDQVNDYNGLSNPPGGYTYGGVLSMRGNNFGFQLWGSHTGDFYFKTQWNNDQYSGWRTVLHSSNYGSYAVPITGTVLTEGNYFYFRSNIGSYLGGLSSPPLQAYSTGGNAAFMSFHRGGSYAVNFGLDQDNVMRIGGWSAAADRWVLDMSGNNTVAGSFRAPIFYDSNDTTYYLDPNSSGTSLKINGGIVSTAGNGAVLLKHENSEANAWIFRENSNNWGLFWFNAGGQSGQTIGSYTTVGAELFGMNNAVTGFNPNSAWSGTDASTRAAWMLSNYSGYLWTQGTQYSQTDMRAPIYYDSNDTNYYLDPASDLSLKVYGEICNSNYQPGRLQPGALNIGRTDLNYAWDGTSWADDVRLGILANTNETWEFGIHDSGDSVMSVVHFDGGSTLTMGRNLGWGQCVVNAPAGYVSNGNAWGTANSAFFPNGITTAGGTNWIYGFTYIGNAPTNGAGTHFTTDGHQYSTGSITTPLFLVNSHSDNTKGYRIHNTSGSSVSAMFTNSANALVIGAGAFDQVQLNKKTFINGAALGVNVAASATAGRIDASNDIVAYSSSDERLKYNIAPIENALDKVKSLTGVEFDWKPEYKHAHGYEGHDTGIIAQQVEAVMPSAVRTNDTGFLAVRYEKLIGLLIEANKELAARVEELEKKLS